MQLSNDSTNLFKAMISASSDLGNVAKTKQAYGYKYAPLDSIFDMLRLVLPKYKLWFTQDVSTDDGKYILETMVMHESGEWLKSAMVMTDTELSGKANATQQLGASITYFKRYVLSAIFGIATDEDVDGNVDAIQRKQEVKSNAKAATQTAQSAPKKIETKGNSQSARDYVISDMTKRLECGEAPASITKDYADILKTDEVRSPENIPDELIIILGRELYKRNESKK